MAHDCSSPFWGISSVSKQIAKVVRAQFLQPSTRYLVVTVVVTVELTVDVAEDVSVVDIVLVAVVVTVVVAVVAVDVNEVVGVDD